MNIHDVAKQCGVSIATVSRVLNENPNVNAQTRARVLKVIRELGYTPNVFARGLGLNSMKMIGIMCTDVSDPYYAKAVSLTEQLLRARGFGTLLCCTGHAHGGKRQALALLLEKRVDGILLIGSPFSESHCDHIRAAAAQVPVVIINGWLDLPNVYSLLCDERGAMARNTAQLAAQGAKHICYLYDALTFSGTEKLAGYRAAVSAAGLPDCSCRVAPGMQAARAQIETMLRSGAPIDAVLTAEDILAVGACKALTAAGRRCPVIGFNNSQLAACASPELTSVDNRLDDLCPAAADLLERVLAGEDAPHRTVLEAQLVERETFRVAE